MKKITLSILLLLSMLSFGQSVQVTFAELKVLNIDATTINFGTNVQSVNVHIKASVYSSFANSTVKGSLAVFYKKNGNTSTTPISPTNGFDTAFYMLNGLTETRVFTITLYRSDFDTTGGYIYLEYKPDANSGSAYRSSNVIVTKIPDPISNNIISGNQTVFDGQSVNTIIGSTPAGGDGTFTYKWQQKLGTGVWTTISGAISSSYTPPTAYTTTSYRRVVTSVAGINGTSNEVTVTVNPAPYVENNTISIDGLTVTGSLPTGGLGVNSYYYTWYVIDQDGDGSELPDTSQSLILTTPTFTRYFNSPNNFVLKRMVTSGNQYGASNSVAIPHVSEIQNNIISINNNIVTGTIPTGGLGNYTYSWAIYYSGDPIEFSETTKDLDITSHLSQINQILQIDGSAKLVRLVTAGISSTSNRLALNSIAITALKKENTLTSAIYPNPTSDSVNFATSFSSNKEIEIIIYSEGLGNAQSVFKGTINPNQVVKWDIPSNYPKGVYYYKIVSDNKEAKSGKIIFQ